MTVRPWIIAHRGASAYAPENTLPAFQLAVEQAADWVEIDLQMTKDRALVVLHDESLERTTDVDARFPTRAREVSEDGRAVRRWMLEDFTLDEVESLDAGLWLAPAFRGTKIPTFAEIIDALRGRAGLFIEIKSPERYPGIERQILDELQAKGLDRSGADPRTPVLLQSFSVPSLRTLSQTFATPLPMHFLVEARVAESWMTPAGLKSVQAFATGISPEKSIVTDYREAMVHAKSMGMPVTPWTFRASAVTGFPDVGAEMDHYLRTLGVDGVITDNPDRAGGMGAWLGPMGA